MIKAQFAAMASFRQNTRMLIFSSGILAVSFFGIQTLLKVLYILRLGYGLEYVGIFSAAGGLGYMAMSLPGGALGSRWGVIPTMLLGGVLTVTGMAILPLVEYLPTAWNQGWPILSQLVSAGGFALFSINLVPALSAATTQATRNNAFALNAILRGMGTFIGTISGGMLPGFFALLIGQSADAPAPYRLSLWLSAGLGLVALLPLLRVGDMTPEEGEGTAAQRDAAFPLSAVIMLALYVALSQVGGATCQSFCSAFMDTELGLSAAVIGLLTGAGQFVAIFAPLIGPRLAERRGHGWTLMMVPVGVSISLLPLILFPTWVGAGVGRLGTLTLAALWMPALQVYQMEMVERQWRSLAYSMVSVGMSLSFSTVSLVGGYIAASFGYPQLFTLGMFVTLTSVVVMWFSQRRSAQDLKKTVTPTAALPRGSSTMGD